MVIDILLITRLKPSVDDNFNNFSNYGLVIRTGKRIDNRGHASRSYEIKNYDTTTSDGTLLWSN